MSKNTADSFTEAEKAAFEWSKRNRSSTQRRRTRSNSSSRSHSRHRRIHRHDDSSDSDRPRDPFNPLKLAYQRNSRHRSSSDRQRSRSRNRNSPPRWHHDLYDDVHEQVAEEARHQRRRSERDITSYQLDTRRGSWRSKAGGVYIPPDRDNTSDEDLYTDYRRRHSRSPSRPSRKSRSYERPDPVYTLD
ncbi:knob-associated histidine-rich protein, putative [Babesia ovis]|uniref:Knob-associated histidine-rich protein, putative n=1 Tax=Babesia ovis TaxID=5869 RepID=A0A9W5WW85_BABOV|nr:knob-associated histidine-rich protein, putative [Babesia ovis]